MPAIEMYVNGRKLYTAAMINNPADPAQMIMGNLILGAGQVATASLHQSGKADYFFSAPPIKLEMGDALTFKIVESGTSDLPQNENFPIDRVGEIDVFTVTARTPIRPANIPPPDSAN